MKEITFGKSKKYKNSLYDFAEFGKYRMKTWKEIIDDHIKYVEWCFDEIPAFDLDDEAKKYYREKCLGEEK